MAQLIGTNVVDRIVPFDTGDQFPTHEALYGRGGLRTVQTLLERDTIPLTRREQGMIVHVIGVGDFILQGGITNSDWQIRSPVNELTLTAGANISSLRVCVIDPLTSEVVTASPLNTDHTKRLFVFNRVALSTGDSSVFLSEGRIINNLWNWDIENPIFLGSNGSLTQDIPVLPTALFSLLIGYPVTTDSFYFKPKEPIILA